MTDLLLGQSYYLRFDPKLWTAMQPYPPLGTLYAAGYARSLGYSVSLFDAMLADSEQAWAQALEEARPKYAVLFEDSFNYLSKMSLLRMRQAAIQMIEMAGRRDCTIIVAGSDATDHPEQYLRAGAHFVLAGEGEQTLGELLDSLSRRQSTRAIPGLAYTNDGAIVVTPRRRPMRDLDRLPFPAWDLVDVERYRSIWRSRHGRWSMNVATSRGCPYHCNWCSKPIWGQTYNVRSPENVVAELRWLERTFRPDHVWFVDDILGLQPGWLERFAQLTVDAGLHLPFKCLGRADLLLRDERIASLRRAGCETLWLGAESGSQRVLDAMEKGLTVEQVQEAARRLKLAGIGVGFFLQFGYPGETLADIQATRDLVRSCEPDDIGVSVSYPLPGTPFYERVRTQMRGQNWIDSSDLAMLYEGTYSTSFYRYLHGAVHREFRGRKYRADLAHVLRRPVRLRPRHLRRAAAAMAYRLARPVDQRVLGWLAQRPGGRLNALPVRLDREEAATPSPQR